MRIHQPLHEIHSIPPKIDQLILGPPHIPNACDAEIHQRNAIFQLGDNAGRATAHDATVRPILTERRLELTRLAPYPVAFSTASVSDPAMIHRIIAQTPCHIQGIFQIRCPLGRIGT